MFGGCPSPDLRVTNFFRREGWGGGGEGGVVTTGVLPTPSALCSLVYNPMQAPFPQKKNLYGTLE